MKNIQLISLAVSLGLLIGGAAIAAGGGDAKTDPNAMEGKHFDTKGKLPSKYTVEAQQHQCSIAASHGERSEGW